MELEKYLLKKGWLDISLQHMCVVLGSILCCLLGIEALYSPLVIRNFRVFITWSLYYFANALLVFGAALELKWFLALWFFFAVGLVIGVPIAVICVLFEWDFHYYVKDFTHPMIMLVFEYLVSMVLYVYCARYVVSLFLEIYEKEKRSGPVHPLAIIL